MEIHTPKHASPADTAVARRVRCGWPTGVLELSMVILRKVTLRSGQLNKKSSTGLKIWRLTGSNALCNHWIHDVG